MPVDSSWLIGCVRRHLPAGVPPEPASLRQALAARLADPRKKRGIRHSLLSVLVAGGACGYSGPLAIAQAAGCWSDPAGPPPPERPRQAVSLRRSSRRKRLRGRPGSRLASRAAHSELTLPEAAGVQMQGGLLRPVGHGSQSIPRQGETSS
jgi:hypothetical protein